MIVNSLKNIVQEEASKNLQLNSIEVGTIDKYVLNSDWKTARLVHR